MYYYLNGTVTLLEEGLAVVECGGVGYACRTTTHTLSQLRLKEPARLWTYLSVREDAMELFGFATREEKRIFEMLLGVGGVGPKAALSLLSTVPPDQLTLAVMTGNEKALTSAPGVGKKMAQRVILELKDKLGANLELDFSSGPVSVPAPDSGMALAMAGLAELGYSQAEITAAMKKIPPETTRTEDIIRMALRAMAMP